VWRGDFPTPSEGSLVYKDGQLIGSRLIGQSYSDPKYFWADLPHDAATLQRHIVVGSNLGPLNPALLDQVNANAKALRDADQATRDDSVELVTASASGLDPDISPAGARYQVARVARARGIEPAKVDSLISAHVQDRLLA